jgi:hypothetical protein
VASPAGDGSSAPVTWACHQTVPSGAPMWMNAPARPNVIVKTPGSTPATGPRDPAGDVRAGVGRRRGTGHDGRAGGRPDPVGADEQVGLDPRRPRAANRARATAVRGVRVGADQPPAGDDAGAGLTRGVTQLGHEVGAQERDAVQRVAGCPAPRHLAERPAGARHQPLPGDVETPPPHPAPGSRPPQAAQAVRREADERPDVAAGVLVRLVDRHLRADAPERQRAHRPGHAPADHRDPHGSLPRLSEFKFTEL